MPPFRHHGTNSPSTLTSEMDLPQELHVQKNIQDKVRW